MPWGGKFHFPRRVCLRVARSIRPQTRRPREMQFRPPARSQTEFGNEMLMRVPGRFHSDGVARVRFAPLGTTRILFSVPHSAFRLLLYFSRSVSALRTPPKIPT